MPGLYRILGFRKEEMRNDGIKKKIKKRKKNLSLLSDRYVYHTQLSKYVLLS